MCAGAAGAPGQQERAKATYFGMEARSCASLQTISCAIDKYGRENCVYTQSHEHYLDKMATKANRKDSQLKKHWLKRTQHSRTTENNQTTQCESVYGN